jgi:hypothetical protein
MLVAAAKPRVAAIAPFLSLLMFDLLFAMLNSAVRS